MQRAVAEMNHVTDAAAAAAPPHPHPRVEVNKNKQLLQWTVGALEIISITANDGKALKPFPTGCIELHSPLYGVVFFLLLLRSPSSFRLISESSRNVSTFALRCPNHRLTMNGRWEWEKEQKKKTELTLHQPSFRFVPCGWQAADLTDNDIGRKWQNGT